MRVCDFVQKALRAAGEVASSLTALTPPFFVNEVGVERASTRPREHVGTYTVHEAKIIPSTATARQVVPRGKGRVRNKFRNQVSAHRSVPCTIISISVSVAIRVGYSSCGWGWGSFLVALSVAKQVLTHLVLYCLLQRWPLVNSVGFLSY